MQVDQLLKSCRDAMIVVDEHGTILRANPAAVGLFNRYIYELVGQPVEVLIADAERPRHQEAFLRYQQAGAPPVHGIVIHSQAVRDGLEFPVEVLVDTFRDAEGQHLIAMIRDLTNRQVLKEEVTDLLTVMQATVNRLEELAHARRDGPSARLP